MFGISSQLNGRGRSARRSRDPPSRGQSAGRRPQSAYPSFDEKTNGRPNFEVRPAHIDLARARGIDRTARLDYGTEKSLNSKPVRPRPPSASTRRPSASPSRKDLHHDSMKAGIFVSAPPPNVLNTIFSASASANMGAGNTNTIFPSAKEVPWSVFAAMSQPQTMQQQQQKRPQSSKSARPTTPHRNGDGQHSHRSISPARSARSHRPTTPHRSSESQNSHRPVSPARSAASVPASMNGTAKPVDSWDAPAVISSHLYAASPLSPFRMSAQQSWAASELAAGRVPDLAAYGKVMQGAVAWDPAYERPYEEQLREEQIRLAEEMNAAASASDDGEDETHSFEEKQNDSHRPRKPSQHSKPRPKTAKLSHYRSRHDPIARLSSGQSSVAHPLTYTPYLRHIAFDIASRQLSAPGKPVLPAQEHKLLLHRLSHPEGETPREYIDPEAPYTFERSHPSFLTRVQSRTNTSANGREKGRKNGLPKSRREWMEGEERKRQQALFVEYQKMYANQPQPRHPRNTPAPTSAYTDEADLDSQPVHPSTRAFQSTGESMSTSAAAKLELKPSPPTSAFQQATIARPASAHARTSGQNAAVSHQQKLTTSATAAGSLHAETEDAELPVDRAASDAEAKLLARLASEQAKAAKAAEAARLKDEKAAEAVRLKEQKAAEAARAKEEKAAEAIRLQKEKEAKVLAEKHAKEQALKDAKEKKDRDAREDQERKDREAKEAQEKKEREAREAAEKKQRKEEATRAAAEKSAAEAKALAEKAAAEAAAAKAEQDRLAAEKAAAEAKIAEEKAKKDAEYKRLKEEAEERGRIAAEKEAKEAAEREAEERKPKHPFPVPKYCQMCEDLAPEIWCPECKLFMCVDGKDGCAPDMHKIVGKRLHKTFPIVLEDPTKTAAAPSSLAPPKPSVSTAATKLLLCAMCEENPATVRCTECAIDLCQKKCDAEVHRPQVMKNHTRTPLTEVAPSPQASLTSVASSADIPPDCSLCDDADAVVHCAACNMFLCKVNGCDADLHAGKNAVHVRKPL